MRNEKISSDAETLYTDHRIASHNVGFFQAVVDTDRNQLQNPATFMEQARKNLQDLKEAKDEYSQNISEASQHFRENEAEYKKQAVEEALADGVEVNYNPFTPHVVRLSETDSFEREGFDGHVYIPSEAGLGYNVLGVVVHGSHPRKRMLGDTTRNYYVIEGQGSFTLGDEAKEVQAGDLFVIPPGGEYEYEGHMKLLEFNVSPSSNIQDKKL